MPRVLLLEDEPLIAMSLSDDLSEHGFTVLGLVGSCDRAIPLLDHADCAILDYHLRGKATCEATARALLERGVPYVILSADSPHLEDGEWAQGCVWLVKPIAIDKVVAALGELLSTKPGSRDA